MLVDRGRLPWDRLWGINVHYIRQQRHLRQHLDRERDPLAAQV